MGYVNGKAREPSVCDLRLPPQIHVTILTVIILCQPLQQRHSGELLSQAQSESDDLYVFSVELSHHRPQAAHADDSLCRLAVREDEDVAYVVQGESGLQRHGEVGARFQLNEIDEEFRRLN